MIRNGIAIIQIVYLQYEKLLAIGATII